MISIRNNVFETNSSSTHSLVILKKEDWEKVKSGELFIDVIDAEKHEQFPRLVTEDFLIEEARKEYEEYHERHTSWEEIMSNYGGNYGGYNLNVFGFAGETYINPKSDVWHKCEEEDLGNNTVKVSIDHYFG